MSRRSQHRVRALLGDAEKWAAYMPQAVEDARRIQFGADPSRKTGVGA